MYLLFINNQKKTGMDLPFKGTGLFCTIHCSPHHFSFVIFMETTAISSNGERELKDEIQGLVASFPSEKNWDGSPLYFCKGVWHPVFAIRGALSFQQHFIAHDTDIILASMPKSGTTWLKALTFSVVNRNIYSPKESPLLPTYPTS